MTQLNPEKSSLELTQKADIETALQEHDYLRAIELAEELADKKLIREIVEQGLNWIAEQPKEEWYRYKGLKLVLKEIERSLGEKGQKKD